MKAVIYARFSSEKQTEASIAAQVRACREYAEGKGHEIVGVYADEAISGKESATGRRTQYQKLLRDAERQQRGAAGSFELILIHKYDRAARSLAEHVSLEKRLEAVGVELIAVAQDFGFSKEAKIMRAVVWSLSEYYNDNLSGEIKKGLRETALKALHAGGFAPFGYDVVSQTYVINELEAAYVRKLFDAVSRREGSAAVLREMKERGIRGKKGKVIGYPQAYEILHNEKYTGVYLYSSTEEAQRTSRRSKPNAIRIENALPEIISRAQFEEVQKIMAEKKQVGARSGYLCSGLVYCECGAKMHAQKVKRKDGEQGIYVCSKHCGAGSIFVAEVDKAAIAYLQELLNEENQRKISDAIRRYQAGKENRMEEFEAVLKKRIREKEKEYKALLNNLSSGMLPASVVADVGQRMEETKAEIEALKATEPPEDFTAEQIQGWFDSLKNRPDEKAIHLLIERIEVKEKAVHNIESTLQTVLGNTGCGYPQHTFPKILFEFKPRQGGPGAQWQAQQQKPEH